MSLEGSDGADQVRGSRRSTQRDCLSNQVTNCQRRKGGGGGRGFVIRDDNAEVTHAGAGAINTFWTLSMRSYAHLHPWCGVSRGKRNGPGRPGDGFPTGQISTGVE